MSKSVYFSLINHFIVINSEHIEKEYMTKHKLGMGKKNFVKSLLPKKMVEERGVRSRQEKL